MDTTAEATTEVIAEAKKVTMLSVVFFFVFLTTEKIPYSNEPFIYSTYLIICGALSLTAIDRALF